MHLLMSLMYIDYRVSLLASIGPKLESFISVEVYHVKFDLADNSSSVTCNL